MEKYSWYFTETKPKKVASLKVEVQQLTEAHHAIGGAERRAEGGSIDGKLAKFLKTLDGFLEATAGLTEVKAEQFREVLRSLDPSGRQTSTVLEDRTIARWKVADDYFQAIAHHRRDSTSEEEFYAHVRIVEEVISGHLTPTTWPNRDALDALIQKAESP